MRPYSSSLAHCPRLLPTRRPGAAPSADVSLAYAWVAAPMTTGYSQNWQPISSSIEKGQLEAFSGCEITEEGGCLPFRDKHISGGTLLEWPPSRLGICLSQALCPRFRSSSPSGSRL